MRELYSSVLGTTLVSVLSYIFGIADLCDDTVEVAFVCDQPHSGKGFLTCQSSPRRFVSILSACACLARTSGGTRSWLPRRGCPRTLRKPFLPLPIGRAAQSFSVCLAHTEVLQTPSDLKQHLAVRSQYHAIAVGMKLCRTGSVTKALRFEFADPLLHAASSAIHLLIHVRNGDQ